MRLLQPWLIGLLLGLMAGNIFLMASKGDNRQRGALQKPISILQPVVDVLHESKAITEKPAYVPRIPETFYPKSKVGERVLCWLILLSLTEEIKTRVEDVWGRHCDKVFYVTKEGSLADNIVAHHYERKNKDLWNQVHRGWSRIAELALNDYDWFVKLDSDSIFLADNFRFMVNQKRWSPDSIAYFGHTIFEQSRPISHARSQFNLGAGYGVSRKLLELIYPYLPNATHSDVPVDQRCPEWIRWGEDVKFGDCLRIRFPSLIPNSTKDETDRETFLPFTPRDHLIRSMPNWYLRGKPIASFNRSQSATGCCSSRQILWHKCQSEHIFYAYYLEMTVMVDPMSRRDYSNWKVKG